MKQTTYAIDNSAILYLALMRKHHTNVYRFTITLKQEVDPDLLQTALDRIYPRFPTIFAGFRPDFFQYTMIPVGSAPRVMPDTDCLRTMTPAEIRSCALRICYRGRDVSLEAFHALTDGYGAIAAFTTLVAEYLRLREHTAIPVCRTLRCIDEGPDRQELEDSYLTSFAGKPLHLPSRFSYQLPGRELENWVRTQARSYDTAAVLAAAREQGVSLTALLSGVMASSIMELQSRHSRRLRPVRIMVPVDLRRMFQSHTLRNFILYALPTMEPGDEHLPLRELLRRFHSQMRQQVEPKRMAAIMARNVRAQASIFFRFIPRALKCALMRTVYRYFGESNSSITLTNLGNVTFPEEMAPHVESMQCILTPRAGSPYNCAVIAAAGRLTITLSRFCPHPELDEIFFTRLDELLAACAPVR